MYIRFGFEITIECDAPTPQLLALSPHPRELRRLVRRDAIHTAPATVVDSFVDDFGNRRSRLLAQPGTLTLRSDQVATDDGVPDVVVPDAEQRPVEALPADVLTFLAPSRYCESDVLTEDAWRLFSRTPTGWPRVQAITDFVHKHIEFGYEFASPTKTAVDAFRAGRGVCRDFAHLAVALCRAMNIPARYASGYLGDIGVPPAGPGDFSAWFEVFLGGRWYTFDARHNTPRIGRILMVRGRDAADVPMISSFGATRLTGFKVWTDEVDGDLAREPDNAARDVWPRRRAERPETDNRPALSAYLN